MTDDVKSLLGRALGDEPPLRIDREAVLRQGRKRLRRKRFIDTGSVVAAVVVAVVGAATLTNLGDSEPERMPPAASSTDPAPPGPQLPIPTSETRNAPSSVETTRPGPPSISASETDPLWLTQLLYATGVVSEDEAQPLAGRAAPPAFVAAPDRYVYEADVIRPEAKGYLQVVVGYASDITTGCGTVVPSGASSDCMIQNTSDVPVTLIHITNADGERRTIGSAKFPTGIRVAVTVSNTIYKKPEGKSSYDRPPVLTDDQLCLLITKVGRGA